MKFYIISIILNIIALFVPIAYYTSGGGGKGKEQDEIVTVNLSESVFNDTSQGAGQKSDGPGISSRGDEDTGVQQKSGEVSQPQQKTNTVSSQNIQQNNQKENVSAVLQNKTEQLKTSKSDNKIPVSQGGTSSAVQPSGNNGKTVQSRGNESGTGTGNGEGKNTDVCNEGKDFTVSYNPNLKYPVAAQRLGNKGVVVVMVKLRFNNSGSVSVISASGGSGVFQQEAKSAASRIRVNVKNPDTLKCTISKPFNFELK